ncbi:MAG: hypothetical protein EOO41_00655 [Methanobacteriota archaeon]|nr:MAG: hypothetical protein EOO41_00655 [Euryarchaeota archaeon]
MQARLASPAFAREDVSMMAADTEGVRGDTPRHWSREEAATALNSWYARPLPTVQLVRAACALSRAFM